MQLFKTLVFTLLCIVSACCDPSCPNSGVPGEYDQQVSKVDLQELRNLVAAAEKASTALHEGLARAKEQLSAHSGQHSTLALHTQRAHGLRATGVLDLQRQPAGEVDIQTYSEASSRLVSKKLPSWDEHFAFQAAIRTDSKALCSAVIRRAHHSPVRYFVLGDEGGRIYIFTPKGYLAAEHQLGHAVTALLTHQPRNNLSTLVVGMRNGDVELLEVNQNISRNGAGVEAITVQHVESVARLGDGCTQEACEGGQQAVTHLALVPVPGTRSFQYVAAHQNGSLAVWRSDGSLRQMTRFDGQLRLLKVVGSQLLLILDDRTATLRLSQPKEHLPDLKYRECASLDGSTISAAAYQQTRGSLGRYYGITAYGQLLTFGAQMLTECRVLHSAPSAPPAGSHARLAALPDVLLLVTDNLAAAYNTTGPVSRHGPLGIVASSIPGVALAAGLMGQDQVERPVLDAASPDLLLLSLGDNIIATFRSVHHRRAAAPAPPFLAWARPVIIVIVALVGVWHFGSKRNGQPFNTRRGVDLYMDRALAPRSQGRSGNPYPSMTSAVRRQGGGREPHPREEALRAQGLPAREDWCGEMPAGMPQSLAADIDRAMASRRRQQALPSGGGGSDGEGKQAGNTVASPRQQMAEQIDAVLLSRRQQRRRSSEEDVVGFEAMTGRLRD